jgi:exosome complex exonuclease RRP6
MEELFPKLASTIRAAAGLAAKDVNFYKNIDSSISEKSDEYSGELLKLINQVVSASGSETTIEQDTIKDSWSVLGNILDNFLERSDIAFDQLKKNVNQNEDADQLTYLDDSTTISSSGHGNKIEKPQLKFKTKIDNSELHPFRPLLTSKPNAVTPFEDVFKIQNGENDLIYYKHPYEHEILNSDYNQDILQKSVPLKFQNWEDTDAIWVDDVKTLNEMLVELRKVDVIAIDLEHHDYRSYYGLVSLMQISTRDQDWLIDTLALRDDLQILNEVFTNPQVTKVLHGAFMDIIWLQRDLGLYIVSLFDTYHASKSLGFPKHSLAYLLERFASFKTSKKYQLADWRIRPLTKQMRLYARADTHFLLYIFDVLKNMLIESNKLTQVLYDSRNVALRRFEYSKFRPDNLSNNSLIFTNFDTADSWRKLMYQYNIQTSKAKLVENLYNWRDEMAKSSDESSRYIMPNQLLAALASIGPTSAEEILLVSSNSSTPITEFVRKNLKDVANLIKESLELSEAEDLNLMNSAMSNFNNSDNDGDESLSVDKAEQNYTFFQQARNDLHASGENAKFNVKRSQLFIQDMLTDNVTYVGRQDIIDSKLNQLVNVVPEANEGDVANDKGPDSNEAEVVQSDRDDEKPDMFENSDDIIVLKKRSVKSNNRADTNKNDKEQIKVEKFDYASAEKIIQNKKQQKSRKRKTEFNPYGKESEGPKPATSKQLPQQGKSTSFVDKKRRK